MNHINEKVENMKSNFICKSQHKLKQITNTHGTILTEH